MNNFLIKLICKGKKGRKCKLNKMDWFLYDRELRHERVKYQNTCTIFLNLPLTVSNSVGVTSASNFEYYNSFFDLRIDREGKDSKSKDPLTQALKKPVSPNEKMI